MNLVNHPRAGFWIVMFYRSGGMESTESGNQKN